MPTINLKGISFRAHARGENDDPAYGPGGSPPGSTTIDLSSIKFRAWVKRLLDPNVYVNIGLGYVVGGSDGSADDEEFFGIIDYTQSFDGANLSLPYAVATSVRGIPSISVSANAAATTSSISPLPKISPNATVAIATASIVAPSILKDVTITSLVATITASVSAPTVIVSVTSIATATVSSTSPIPKIEITSIATATASATASVSVSGGSVTITSPANNATASIGTVIVSISVTSIATSTASISSPTPTIEIASISTATASVTAPTTTGGTQEGGSPFAIGEDAIGT